MSQQDYLPYGHCGKAICGVTRFPEPTSTNAPLPYSERSTVTTWTRYDGGAWVAGVGSNPGSPEDRRSRSAPGIAHRPAAVRAASDTPLVKKNSGEAQGLPKAKQVC